MAASFFFPSSQADLLLLDAELSGSTHRLKEISGSSRNCWWRAAWVTIFSHFGLIKDGDQLFRLKLSEALAAANPTELQDAFTTVEAMVSAVRTGGIEEIFTQTDAARHSGENACREEPSNLCIPSSAVSRLGAEEACQQLTNELLRLAGITEDIRLQVVYACELGDDVHLEVLCRAFAVDLCIFSQPWKWSPTTGRTLDEQATYLRVLASFESSIFDLSSQVQEDRVLCTSILSSALASHCVLVHHSSHFNVYIPDKLFRRLRGQTDPSKSQIVVDTRCKSLADVSGELESMGFSREYVELALEVSETNNLDDLIDCLRRLDLH